MKKWIVKAQIWLLNRAMKKVLRKIDTIVEGAEIIGYCDSQEYLNWEDTLNSISCKDHSYAKIRLNYKEIL